MEFLILGLILVCMLLLIYSLYFNISKSKQTKATDFKNSFDEIYLKLIEKNQESSEKIHGILFKNSVDNIKNINDEILKLNKMVVEVLDTNFDKNSKEMSELKESTTKNLSENKEKLNQNFHDLSTRLSKNLSNLMEDIMKRFHDFQEKVQLNLNENIDKINVKVEERLNEGFEKTNKTFDNVIERLTKIDQAQKEIENLSKNVVSLQEVLQDKKSRGTFGEVQLENLVEKIFGAKNDKIYERQYKLSNGYMSDLVLKLPEPNNMVCIDSKFPLENYRKMIDRNLSETERKDFENLFKADCKKHINDISRKYIMEGVTSDYALMFLPAEAIFAEINAYHQDLIDYSYSKKVFIVSPTTIMASLTSIQILLRDIERDKQSKVVNEHLKVLGTEFGRFKDRWDKLKKNIDTVSKQAEDVYKTSEKISDKFNRISNVEVKAIEEIGVKLLDETEVKMLD